MGLSDPFSTTYQGSMQSGESLGQGIQSAAGSVADVMNQKAQQQQQMKQRQQGFQTLQNLGLIKQNQPTNDDLAKGLQDYGQKMGVQVNVNQGDNPDSAKKNMVGIYKALGLPIPKGSIDVMPGTTIDAGGGDTYTAPQKQRSIVDQVAEYQQAQNALQDKGSTGIPTVDAKGNLSIKSPTGAVKDVNSTAKTIVDGIQQGNLPPTLSGMSRTAGLSAAIEVEAQKRGFNLKDAQVDYTALNQLTKTMNQNQMVQLNTAFNGVENDIPVMQKASNDLERTGFDPANSIIVKADLNGVSLSPNVPEEQVEAATKYITQINVMRDSMAVAFMRGGVPSDQALKMTDNILNPAYSDKQIGAALDQVQTNLNMRKSAVQQNKPYVPGESQGSPQSTLQAAGMGQRQSQQSSKYTLVQ